MTQPAVQALADTLLSRSLEAGSIVVFVGAGASRSAGAPSWTDLVDDTIRISLDRPEHTDDSERATIAAKAIRDVLRKANATPSPLHRAIAQLRPQAIVTTNFDDLIERALLDAGDEPTVVTGAHGDHGGDSGASLVYKLHGSPDRPETLALSPGAALTARESTAKDWRLRTLLSTSLVLLIGYTPDSGELEALYEEFGFAALKRNWFLLAASEDPISQSLWHRRGVETVHVQDDDVSGVLTVLAKPRSSYDVPVEQRDERRVFISSGRATTASAEVARLVRTLGLRPLELSETSAIGRTLFERLDDAAQTSAAAIVLLEADGDSGQVRNVRENISFELGFLAGRLGPNRVLVVVAPGAVVPSDLAGVRYALIDDGGLESSVRLWAQTIGLLPTA